VARRLSCSEIVVGLCGLLICFAPGAARAAEITLGGYTLSADEIAIDDSADTITATGHAGLRGPDGKLTADGITAFADSDWKAIKSVGAHRNVGFDFVVAQTGAEGNRTARRFVGSCAHADWKRDPQWKGEPRQDKGIVTLTGKVQVKITSEGQEGTVGQMACETLTLYMNQGRYVAKGGGSDRAEITLGFPDEGSAGGDSD
jgi:hypothetical protein